MNYWIIKDGESVGPFDTTQLTSLDISEDTKVWRRGLENWTPAREVGELGFLFAPDPEEAPATTAGQPSAPENEAPPALRCPYTRLKAAIITTAIVTILVAGPTVIEGLADPFFYVTLPFGLLSIRSAIRTKRLWDNGEIRRARRQSSATATWITLNVIVALVVLPFQFVASLFG